MCPFSSHVYVCALLHTITAYKITKKKVNLQIFSKKNCTNAHFLPCYGAYVMSGLAMQGDYLLQPGGVSGTFRPYIIQFA